MLIFVQQFRFMAEFRSGMLHYGQDLPHPHSHPQPQPAVGKAYTHRSDARNLSLHRIRI